MARATGRGVSMRADSARVSRSWTRIRRSEGAGGTKVTNATFRAPGRKSTSTWSSNPSHFAPGFSSPGRHQLNRRWGSTSSRDSTGAALSFRRWSPASNVGPPSRAATGVSVASCGSFGSFRHPSPKAAPTWCSPPHVVLGPGQDEWRAYFSRTLPKLDPGGGPRAYEVLMKYGPERNYWNESCRVLRPLRGPEAVGPLARRPAP